MNVSSSVQCYESAASKPSLLAAPTPSSLVFVSKYPHWAPLKSPLGRVLQIWSLWRKQPVQRCLSKESLTCPLSTSSLPDTPLPGKSFLDAFHRVPFSDLSKAREEPAAPAAGGLFWVAKCFLLRLGLSKWKLPTITLHKRALTLRAVQSPYPLRLEHLVGCSLQRWKESTMLHWGWWEHSKFVWIKWFLTHKSQLSLDGLKTFLFIAYIF